jgi:hypothetical protein
MASAWTHNGPVSLPPRSLAYGAGAVIALMILVGLAMGYHAALRQGLEPGLGDNGVEAASTDTLTARPIVELPPPVAAPAPAQEAAKTDATSDDEAKAKELAAQTAAAQAIQAKPSKAAGDIDDILTSASEKPPAPAPAPADPAPPGPPVKSDVPF